MNLQELMGLVATTGRQAREDVAGYFKPTTDLVNPNAIDPNVYRNIDMNPYTLKENQEARKFGAIRKLPITNKEILGRALKGGAGLGDVIPTSAIGTGALAGMAKVFHGSPHLFKKFDMSKIGRGQGAQAYGHGLYFADRPETAKSYADTLGYKGYEFSPTVERKYRASYNELENKYKHLGLQSDKKMSETYIDSDGYERLKNYDHPEVLPLMERQDEIGAQLTKLDTKMKNEGGREITSSTLYKADIPDKQIEKMIDWDKPMSEQPMSIRKILRPMRDDASKSFPNIKNKDMTGGEIHNAYADHRGGNKAIVRDYLHQKGVTGIKYLDQGSRRFHDKSGSWKEYGTIREFLQGEYPKINAKWHEYPESSKDMWRKMFYKNNRNARGEATRNYVVFDEKLPTIEEINNKVVTRKLR